MSLKGSVLGAVLAAAALNGAGAQTMEETGNRERDCNEVRRIDTRVVISEGIPEIIVEDPRCTVQDVRLSAPEQCQQMAAKGFVLPIGCNR